MFLGAISSRMSITYAKIAAQMYMNEPLDEGDFGGTSSSVSLGCLTSTFLFLIFTMRLMVFLTIFRGGETSAWFGLEEG